MRRKFLDARAVGRFLHDLPQHFRRHTVAPHAAGLVDRAEHRPLVIPAAVLQTSTAALTHCGTGTVRICPALPFRSAITQCSSRTWMESIAKDRSSPRRRPQPISIARMAWFRFPRSVPVSDRSSRSLPWAGVSQLPTRTPRRRTPLTRRIPAPSQQSRVARLISHAAYRRQTQIDGLRSVPFLLQVNPVSQYHGAIEGQARLGAIPLDEVVDGMVVRSLPAHGGEGIEDSGFSLFEIRQCQDLLRRFVLLSRLRHGRRPPLTAAPRMRQ